MIVKSKRDWYYYFYAVCFVVSFFGPLIGVIPSIQKWGFNSSTLFLIIMQIPFVFLFGLYLWRCGNIIKVDKFEKVISFKNVFTRITTKYYFDEIDGYVSGRLERGKERTRYKVLWIVKDGKLRKRIDEMFIKNVGEIEAEMKQLKHLGYQYFPYKKRFKMIFGDIPVE